MTLEQALKFIKAKEAGKRSASRLLLPQATDTVTRSSYKKTKRTPPRSAPSKDQDACTHCGLRGHGQNPPTRVRRKECPAFGTKYGYCEKDHHFKEVCRAKHCPKLAKDTDHEDMVSESLRRVTSTNGIKVSRLTHHVFDKFTKEWLRRRSKPQPYVRLQMSIW